MHRALHFFYSSDINEKKVFMGKIPTLAFDPLSWEWPKCYWPMVIKNVVRFLQTSKEIILKLVLMPTCMTSKIDQIMNALHQL